MTTSKYTIYIWGITGSIGISIVFYLIQTIGMQDFLAPLEFSRDKWYFVFPLIVGFGIQMGLFRAIHLKAKAGGGAVAVSGGVSTTAMIACCMHNLTTLLPILGLSGMALFLAQYQDYIFGISLLSVAGGMIYMWRKYKKLHICHKT